MSSRWPLYEAASVWRPINLSTAPGWRLLSWQYFQVLVCTTGHWSRVRLVRSELPYSVLRLEIHTLPAELSRVVEYLMSWGQDALSKYLHSFRGCIPITTGVLTRYLPVLLLVYIPVYLVSLTPEPDTAGAEFSVLDVGQLCQWDSDSSWHSWDLTPEQLAPPAEPLNTESHVGSFTEFNQNNNNFKYVVTK